MMCAGAFIQSISDTKKANYLLWQHRNEISECHGKIVSEPVIRNSLRLNVSIEKVVIDGSIYLASGTIVTYFKKEDSLAHMYHQGDKIVFNAHIQEIKPNSNPYAFDFKTYLKNRRIDFQSSVKPENHTLISRNNAPIIKRWASNLRSRSISILEKHLEGRNLAIASAMILGYKNHLDDDLYNAYTDSGAVHVLAVSGLHVGIVAMIFIFLFSKMNISNVWFKLTQTFILIGIIGLFAMMTGAAPAVVRSALMFSIFIIAKYWFPHYNIYNAIAISAIIMLMVEPNLLYQASFQFSYLALSSIVFFQPRLTQLYYSSFKSIDYIKDLALLSISAQGFVFPITLFYFHKFPSYFILSGIIAIPLATAILPTGLLLIVMDAWAPSFIVDVIVMGLNGLLDLLNLSITSIQRLPFSKIDGIWLNWYELAIIYLAITITVVMLITYQKKLIKYVACIVVVFLTLKIVNLKRQHNQLSLVIYDNYKSPLMDIVDGKNLFTIGNNNNNFQIAQNFRTKISPYRSYQIEDGHNYSTNNLSIFNNEICVDNQSILILESDKSLPQNLDFFDMVIIQCKLDNDAIQLLNSSTIREIIVCSNLKKREISYIKKNVINKSIYDVKQNGALIIKI